ncbi:MAG: hypothetical protein DI551_06175 [Micavibrio aeruginosavorus]|uniref:Uncharacterized protein n=1 Tax=Micavibrio aeruginosavorus TaxID=349221 RepID=A0A2W5PMM6_9BACT|nr:MAG: hypothetical protein DI551_06175 [Micavibrio aeruginosavorus]
MLHSYFNSLQSIAPHFVAAKNDNEDTKRAVCQKRKVSFSEDEVHQITALLAPYARSGVITDVEIFSYRDSANITISGRQRRSPLFDIIRNESMQGMPVYRLNLKGADREQFNSCNFNVILSHTRSHLNKKFPKIPSVQKGFSVV